jgi:hypothetical protein
MRDIFSPMGKWVVGKYMCWDVRVVNVLFVVRRSEVVEVVDGGVGCAGLFRYDSCANRG